MNGWIKISDCKPPVWRAVLVFIDGPEGIYMRIAMRHNSHWRTVELTEIPEPAYWQELPGWPTNILPATNQAKGWLRIH